MLTGEPFDLLGEVVLDAKNRPVRLIKVNGVTFNYYVGPDAHGFIVRDGTGEYLMVGNEKRWWRGIIDSAPEKVADSVVDFGLMAIKPDAFQRQLDRMIRLLIETAGLDIVRTKLIRLDQDQLFRLYPYFFEPNWEAALVRYFCSAETLFLLVTGQDVIRKGLEVREYVRAHHRIKDDHPVINLIHSPDTREDAYREASIIFGKEGTINSAGPRKSEVT